VEDSISNAGDVPSPTAGQIGYHLEATAAGTFGWVITTELPTPTAAQVTNNSVMSATSAAVGGVTLTTAPAAGGRAVNLLHNGAFQIAQHGTSFTGATVPINGDDTYTLDRWILQTDETGGADVIDVAQETTIVPVGALNSISLDVERANQKFGILQVIEAEDTARAFANGTGKVSVSFEAYLPAAASTVSTLRVGVLSWVGTADAVTSDVVGDADWAAAGTNPTLATSWAYENTPANLTLVDDTWTTFTETDIALDTSGTTNLAVFIWCDDTDGTVGDIVYIGNVQLVIGDRVDTYGHRPYAEELATCQRFLQVISADTIADPFAVGFNESTTLQNSIIHLPVAMRVAPTAVVVGSALTDFRIAHEATTTVLSAGPAFTTATPTAVKLQSTVAAGLTAGQASILEAVNTNAVLTFSAEL
jgi:hypothetical protein